MNALGGAEPAAEKVRTRARWAAWIALAVAGLKEIGPYVAIEIILPGGTLIALLLWLYRRRQSAPAQRLLKLPSPFKRRSVIVCPTGTECLAQTWH
jgi:hypothetical protein